MTSEPILKSRHEGAVAVLEINRPAARNSLSPALVDAIDSALRALRHNQATCAVVITGADGCFCAGADITGFDDMRQVALLGDSRAMDARMWPVLAEFPKPVIAAVEGLALGGGLELALACDIAIAGTSARFGVPEVKLGVIPGAGGTQRLIRAVGKSTAMTMLLSGEFVDAQTALAAGLVSEVTPDGTALDRALALAERIARNSPMAVALAKDAALASFETSLSQGLQHEKRNFHIALASDDSHEGQAAFLAKRAPEFTGK
ncbi:enoyl-CoA hydratase-related protein [Nocardia sp. NPDC051833]|uniref:enoyl-CoA hydratase-related protein n=1 Tax=Nocardia sp. NPDC051833 TaxID=3155674 RepID=UPI003449FF52